jgi:hypothetical protein
MNYNYRPLDFPKNLLPDELITCEDAVVLTIDVPATSFYWNDNNNSTSNSIVVDENGTYKCYVDYLGQIKTVCTNVVFKDEITQPDIDTTGQSWDASGNSDSYQWYDIYDHLAFIGTPYVPPTGANPQDYNITGVNLVNKWGAVYITGEDDYIELENSDFLNSADAFTIEGWINIHQYSTWDQLFTKRVSNTNRISLELADGKFYFEIGNGSNSYGYTPSLAIDENSWHHIAMVYDGTMTGNSERMKLFIDGQQKLLNFNGTIPSQTPANNSPFTIGSPDMDPGFEFTETRLWSRSLSQNEIELLKNIVLEQGMDEGLEYYFRTEEGSGNILTNYSLNNNYNATIINSGNSAWVNDFTDVMSYECHSLKWNVADLITGGTGQDKHLDFKIIPNPNNGNFVFSLHLPDKTKVIISIYDMSGHLIKREKYGKTDSIIKNINLNGTTKGTYILEIKAGKQNGKQLFLVK